MDIETKELNEQFKPFKEKMLTYISGDTVFHAFQLLSAVRLSEALTLPFIIQGEVCDMGDGTGMVPVNTFLPFDLERTYRLSSFAESDEEQLKKIMFGERASHKDEEEPMYIEVPSRQMLLSVRFGEDMNRDGWSWPDINLTTMISASLPDPLVQLLTELRLRVSMNDMEFDSECLVDRGKSRAKFKFFYPTETGRPEWRSFFKEGDNIGIPIIRDQKTSIEKIKVGRRVVEGCYHHEIGLPSDISMVIFRGEL